MVDPGGADRVLPAGADVADVSSRYDDEIVVVRAPLGPVSGRGGRRRLWDQAQRSPAVPASVQPLTSTEDGDGRQTTVRTWKLLGGPLDLLSTDRVEWPGLVDDETGRPVPLEVDGEVGRWRRNGRTHHVEAVLKRVTDGT